jgi:uncharacterized membrane protein
MSQAPMSTDVTSDDKLWAALGYPIPIIALIVLFMEDKKNRPFIKFHAIQSLALWVVYIVVSIVLGLVTFGFGAICVPLLWLAFLYCAYLAYQGKMFEVPVVTNFLKNQGWV